MTLETRIRLVVALAALAFAVGACTGSQPASSASVPPGDRASTQASASPVTSPSPGADVPSAPPEPSASPGPSGTVPAELAPSGDPAVRPSAAVTSAPPAGNGVAGDLSAIDSLSSQLDAAISDDRSSASQGDTAP